MHQNAGLTMKMRLHFRDMKGNKLDTLQSCTAILVAATATYSSSLQPRNGQHERLHELKKQQLVKERKIIVCSELTPHPNMLEECIAIRIATAVQKKNGTKLCMLPICAAFL